MVSINWTRENIAWAAGLFEGEGCISLKKRTVQLQIGMTDRDVLEKFSKITGIGKLYGPYSDKRKPSYKPIWVWMCHGHKKSQAIIAAFWEFLCERRKIKAMQVLSIAAKWEPHGSVKTFCRRGHAFSDENTYVHRGKRSCKTCRSIHSLAYKIKSQSDGNSDLQ